MWVLQKNHQKETAEKNISDILQYIDISEAAGMDKISRRYSKDDANILVNTSISLRALPK